MALRSSKRRKAKRGTTDHEAADTAEIPKSNLMMTDIIMRTGSYVLRSFVEKRVLKGSFDKQTAKRILKNRSLGSTLTSVAIAKIATRSVPGAAIVGTGVLVRALYDRGKARRDGYLKDEGPSPTSNED